MKLYLIFIFILYSYGFYLPGISPTTYKNGDDIEIKYNKVFSDKTQLPFEYTSLPVCPSPEKARFTENLGEILRGDRILNSPFKVKMGQNVACDVLCDKLPITEKDSKRLEYFVKTDYKVEWIIENLPGATPYKTSETGKKLYEQGFKLGAYDSEKKQTIINNHFNLVILYNNEPDAGGSRIVGFEVYPKSIYSEGREKCPPDPNSVYAPQIIGDKTEVLYTYSVEFKEEPLITWANRWNLYLSNSDPQVHWYSIINSLIILMFLSGMVAIIMLRTFNNDITGYNEEDLKEDQEEVTGWKLVHGDVFRAPKNSGMLAIFVGSGVQFFGMIIVTIAFALIGVLNPSYRGGMLSFSLFLFFFMGVFGGYYSARLYKVFKGSSWQKNAFLTGFTFPGLIFTIYFLLNLFIWSQSSSSATPFGTFVALVVLWFCISLPLVFLGAYFGQKKKAIEHPVRTNQIPRQIPELNWFLHPVVSVLIGGLLPFAVIFIELFFIMKSIWQDQYYYMFGFLTIVFLMLMITCVEITIVIIYFQLCCEDYRWWWRSFLISSSSAFYIFLYAIFYYVTRLDIVAFVPFLVYFTYILLGCLVYFLCTGTIGFFATYAALRRIYSAIKVD